MKDECLICSAPLEYLEVDIEMECEICHKKELSKTRCTKGHYVCNECHTKGIDAIIGVCLSEKGRDPYKIINKLMNLDFCHMHGPEHHIMVGASLLTAYKNSGGELDLEKALIEMQSRGKKVPGGACGFWGACGAGVSAGMYMSVATGSTPLKNREWALSNLMTSRVLSALSEIGGPRCCKRNSYIAIREAIKLTKEELGVEMDSYEVYCSNSHKNNQCIGTRCPFYKKKIAFICVHNSCRSQIAEALGKHFLGDRYEFYSAGTETKPVINGDAVRLVKSLYGIDMLSQNSKTADDIPTPDIAISMGCDVGCPYIGRAFDDDWGLPDPTGKSDEEFIKVIKEIENKIKDKSTFAI